MQRFAVMGASLVAFSFLGVDAGCKAKGANIGGFGGTGGVSGTTAVTNAASGTQATNGTTAGGFSTTGPGTTGPSTTAGVTTTVGATTVTSTVGATTVTTTTGATTSSASTGSGGMCKTPATLHPPPTGTANTLYCPFSGTPAIYCDPSMDHCCEPMTGTSTCTANGTMCAAGDMDWGCEDPVADCGGTKCCTNAGVTIMQNIVNGTPCPGDYYAVGMHQTMCASSCGIGLQMCTKTSECPTGMTCQAFRKSGAQVGACQ